MKLFKRSYFKRKFSKLSSPLMTWWEKRAIARTGRIRRFGNLFDLRYPRITEGIRSALEKGTYEAREIGMIHRHIRPEDRVVELGACIGATTMVLVDTVGADKLVVYEADPRNLAMAQHNFGINDKRIDCRNMLLWSGAEQPETVVFASNENPSSSSLIDRPGAEQSFAVPTRDFDEALAEHLATALVLDIEGGEIDLFAGAGEMPGLRTIIMETHARVSGPEAVANMLAQLQSKGFEAVENVGEAKYIVLKRKG